MKIFLQVTKALADENRIRALLALRGRELCVCQIIELLGLAPSTVSKHMSILRQAGLVEGRKDGRWVHYRLAGEDAQTEVYDAIDWVCDTLGDTPGARADEERMQEILQIGLETLCRRKIPS